MTNSFYFKSEYKNNFFFRFARARFPNSPVFAAD